MVSSVLTGTAPVDGKFGSGAITTTLVAGGRVSKTDRTAVRRWAGEPMDAALLAVPSGTVEISGNLAGAGPGRGGGGGAGCTYWMAAASDEAVATILSAVRLSVCICCIFCRSNVRVTAANELI